MSKCPTRLQRVEVEPDGLPLRHHGLPGLREVSHPAGGHGPVGAAPGQAVVVVRGDGAALGREGGRRRGRERRGQRGVLVPPGGLLLHHGGGGSALRLLLRPQRRQHLTPLTPLRPRVHDYTTVLAQLRRRGGDAASRLPWRRTGEGRPAGRSLRSTLEEMRESGEVGRGRRRSRRRGTRPFVEGGGGASPTRTEGLGWRRREEGEH